MTTGVHEDPDLAEEEELQEEEINHERESPWVQLCEPDVVERCQVQAMAPIWMVVAWSADLLDRQEQRGRISPELLELFQGKILRRYDEVRDQGDER